MGQPVLDTPRLILRPFTLDDVADVTRLAGDRLIADTTPEFTRDIDRLNDRLDARQVGRTSVFGSVEVDQVQTIGSLFKPMDRHRSGIFAENRLLSVIALT